MARYKGFSSWQYQRKKTFSLTDVELVKEDLLNHIFTRRGERVMMPRFGTIIPDLAFEPLDDITLETLESELRTVFEYDPRVQLVSLNLTPDYDNYRVLAEAHLLYIELNKTDDLNLNIQFAS